VQIEVPTTMKDWEVKPVGDVFDINPEALPTSTSPEFRFRYIPLEAVYTERIDFDSVQEIRFGEAPSRARRVIRRGDLLISTVRPNLQGFAEFLPPDDGPYVCSTGFAVLRAKDGYAPQVYLQELLSDLGASQFHSYVTGTNYPAVSARDFSHLRLIVPSASSNIERQMGSVLRGISSSITATRDSLAQAEQLQTALMQQLFTGCLTADGTLRPPGQFQDDEHFGRLPKRWKAERLGKLLSECQYGLSRAMTETGQYPIFRMNNIERGRMIPNPLAYIDLSQPEFTKYRVNRGDILFNRTNSLDLVGKVGIFELDGDFVFASYLIRLVAEPPNDPRFINYYLNSYQGQKRIRAKVTPAISQANVNTRSLKAVWTPKPPPDEQRSIADTLDNIHSLIIAKQEKIAALHGLKKSLMQNLLTGRIPPKHLSGTKENSKR
jgi:type I restriction enzyme S subunit